MNVTQISIGRFHHFHLARQMERLNMLDSLWTGYIRYKLKDELGIPTSKINTFPWLHTPYMLSCRFGLDRLKWLDREWSWYTRETLDRYVASTLRHPTVVVALSGSGLHAGSTAQRIGGHYICDRGSSHIRFQNAILNEEYTRWNLEFAGVDPRIIDKEEIEYEQAEVITVPSEFVKRSFISMGVPEKKLVKIPYGVHLKRFRKVSDPVVDQFRVLWVGAVSVRKGFIDLLTAFRNVKHDRKELMVVGTVTSEIKGLLASQDLAGVTFCGSVANEQLVHIYNSSHAFVLPSIEEGLAMVQGEALACGCPVIATPNTGSEDIFSDGVEGFIVPIRSPGAIADRLQQLADDKTLRAKMSEAALERVQNMKGWDVYGDAFATLLSTFDLESSVNK